MNSWHSFSPNGRWLVFSSKSRSPYTQMYLTHIDEEGNYSPAILIDDSTAANRAVNIPEFVNIPPDGLRKIGGPAIEYYRLVDRAVYLEKMKQYKESIAQWGKVLEVSPDDAMAHSHLGNLLLLTGLPQEAAAHLHRAKEIRLDDTIAQLRKALEFDSGNAPTHYNLGLVLAERGEMEEAIRQWQKALEINPSYAEVLGRLGNALYMRGETADALAHWRAGIRLQPNDLPVLQQTAWVLATCPDASIRNGIEAVKLALQAVQLSGGEDAVMLDTLAAAYAELGRYKDAAVTARRALALATQKNQRSQMETLESRIASVRSREAVP